MKTVERNIVYACVDVAFRDSATGALFFPNRIAEPQSGAWFMGGRQAYNEGFQENASVKAEQDLGIEIPSLRFEHIATYSTPFSVASTSRRGHGRHTTNVVMLAELDEDEVASLNEQVASGKIDGKEYNGGQWYSPDQFEEMADPDSEFPFAIKQFIRDLSDHDLLKEARAVKALQTNEQRSKTS